MSGDLLNELNELGSQVDGLLADAALARDREEAFRLRIEELEREVARLQSELSLLEGKLDKVAIEKGFGPNSEDSRRARKVLLKMVQEIDACIALLRG